MSRSWNGSEKDFRFREGMAEAERTVGFALMSSGIFNDGILIVGGKLLPAEIFIRPL